MRVFLGLILGSAASLGIGVLAYHLKQHASGVGNFIPRERLRRLYCLVFCKDRQASRQIDFRDQRWSLWQCKCLFQHAALQDSVGGGLQNRSWCTARARCYRPSTRTILAERVCDLVRSFVPPAHMPNRLTLPSGNPHQSQRPMHARHCIRPPPATLQVAAHACPLTCMVSPKDACTLVHTCLLARL
jgi:hypothetical protein